MALAAKTFSAANSPSVPPPSASPLPENPHRDEEKTIKSKSDKEALLDLIGQSASYNIVIVPMLFLGFARALLRDRPGPGPRPRKPP